MIEALGRGKPATTSDEGRQILRRRTGKVRLGKDRQFATILVKARELSRGDYILILFGHTSHGKSEESTDTSSEYRKKYPYQKNATCFGFFSE
jgi:hypothetical protein